MCKVLKVSESGYYRWLKNGSKPRSWQLLLVEINKIFAEHPDNDNYGVERVQTGTNRVKVKDAWDEKVATGQVCTGCGKHSN